jgi:hypothetical protein
MKASAGVALSLAALLFSLPEPGGAAPTRTGIQIYRQQCAKCHGRQGQGVLGKHEGPLQGDRSLDRLTRYIARNMPDDAPGTCTGEDAAAVAQYIYHAFYSQEARARTTKPPRIELVHLTNLQYLNSVADLFKEFTAQDQPLGAEHGLLAVYYNSKGFDGDRKTIERLDRVVDFDFGEHSPDEKLNGTNGFSMQWHGSVIADETGDYQFFVSTPNGARLWVNDESEPLIDAWVASGQISEYKATLRLLGGRAYPLKLHYSKSKEKTGAISLQWQPPRQPRQPIPARNLSPDHSSPTFVITTPFPADDSSLGYERGLSVSKAWDDATTSAALEAANYTAQHLDRLSHTKSADTNRLAELEALCTNFITAAFHRPSEQYRRLATEQFKKAIKPEDAVRRVVLFTLKSPRFLYPGFESGTRDDYEVSARLAYELWDSLPDRNLRHLAGQGALHTREEVRAQAERMLQNPRTRDKMLRFFQHWLQMDRVDNLAKDEQLFPGFTPAIIGNLRTSLNRFLDDTMWSEASDYRTLLLADYLYVNQRLADFYGLNTNVGDVFAKVSLAPSERAGVLTHPYLLAAFSYYKFTSPIHRGVFLTRNIVGRALKPPPMAMTFKDADFAPNLTMRDKVAKLTQPQACQNCHSVINPLGFTLEQFDAVGRFRTLDQDQPIDPVSDYLTEDGQTVHLAGARDVAQFAVTGEEAQAAFIQHLFNHVVKQPMLAYGSDTRTRLRQSFAASEFNMRKLLVEIATLSALHGVKETQATARR